MPTNPTPSVKTQARKELDAAMAQVQWQAQLLSRLNATAESDDEDWNSFWNRVEIMTRAIQQARSRAKRHTRPLPPALPAWKPGEACYGCAVGHPLTDGVHHAPDGDGGICLALEVPR